MALIFIHLLIIFSALWTAARNVYEPQQYRRSIEVQDVQGNFTEIPLKDVGYTQNTIGSTIHDNSPVEIPFESVLEAARNDPEGAVSYVRAKFPQPLMIYRHQEYGLLSIDNRRLYLFKTLAPDGETKIPVEIITEEEAGDRLRRGNKKITAKDALKGRLTTKDGGKSIRIRPGDTSEDGVPGPSSGEPGSSNTESSSRKSGNSSTKGSSIPGSSEPGPSGTQVKSTKSGTGISKPGSSGMQGGSTKPGSSKPGGPSTPSQGGFGKSAGPKKQGGSKSSRRPKRHAAYRIRY